MMINEIYTHLTIEASDSIETIELKKAQAELAALEAAYADFGPMSPTDRPVPLDEIELKISEVLGTLATLAR